MITNLLPIGSIVCLKGGEKRLMIFGIKQVSPDDMQVEYDYVGVCYPEGNMGVQTQYLFNHQDIEEITVRGYEDEERINFIENLGQIYQLREERK